MAQISLLKKSELYYGTAAALHVRYSRTTLCTALQLYGCSTVRVREAAVLQAARALLLSCNRDSGSTAELYESCSTAVLVLVLGIPTAVGELTY